MKKYLVNEMFYSLQGEGARAGVANVFIRLAGCNLRCTADEEGFDCDTEFASGIKRTAKEIVETARELSNHKHPSVILTGGEPTLQADVQLLRVLKNNGFYVCMETNGTKQLQTESLELIDWISCSPKTAEHTLRIQRADELRYVRNKTQGIPRPSLKAQIKFISPAWGPDGLDPEDLAHCIQLVKDNPEWTLSTQQHKLWNVR